MRKLKIFSVLCFALYTINVSAQEPFELIANIADQEIEGNHVLLAYHNGTTLKYDTTKVRNGRFTIKGNVRRPMKVILFIQYAKEEATRIKKAGQAREFYLSGGTTIVKGPTFAKASIIGGVAQQDYDKLQEQLQEIGWKESSEKDDAMVAKRDSIHINFLCAYPASVVSADLMRGMSNPNFFSKHYKEMEGLFPHMPEEWQSSDEGKKVVRLLAGAKKLGIGKEAIDFTMNDVSGKPVKLSDFRGKYVLLDFWASWCMPCRAENPHLVEAYNKFKDSNFTILGVSLDKESAKKEWLAAIEKDGLPWTHVSDLKGWENAAARAYDVQSIPVNYLIDPKGKIIAVSLRGDKLTKRLESIL